MVNKGYFVNGKYVKAVNFNKAVLWKTRELSLPEAVMNEIINRDVTQLDFIDSRKREVWSFPVSRVKEAMRLKTEGQEPQYYFRIELGESKKI